MGTGDRCSRPPTIARAERSGTPRTPKMTKKGAERRCKSEDSPRTSQGYRTRVSHSSIPKESGLPLLHPATGEDQKTLQYNLEVMD